MLNKLKVKELMKDSYVKNVIELSRMTHIPYSTLNHMLQGYDMHVGSIIELSKFFNVPVDDLICKSYKVVGYTEKSEIIYNTTNLMEATLNIISECRGFYFA